MSQRGYVHTPEGRCHCGAIRLTLHTDKVPAEFVPRGCVCSFCTAQSAAWISDPAGMLVVHTAPEARYYQFAHRTARFVFCGTCGVLVCALSEAEGALRAVVNAPALPGYTFPAAQPVDFGDETREQRLARRARNWIGNVAVHERAP